MPERRARRCRILVLGSILALGGAAARAQAGDTSPAPYTPWKPPYGPPRPTPVPPPAGAPGTPARPAAVPQSWLQPGATVTLPEVIDLALRNNPITRTAWLQARAAAAHVGSEKGAYYPSVDLDFQVNRQQQAAVGGQFSFRSTTYGPSVVLDYLLLDFGGRAASVDEARRALWAANWSHNAAIQDVLLEVSSSYYQYQGFKALRTALKASLKESETSLDAADARRRVGVATIADVLQARTANSQARLLLDTVEGQIQIVRGALATAVGVPANIPLDVNELPQPPDYHEVIESVDDWIEKAEKSRPDLQALREKAEEARSHARAIRAEGEPTLVLEGSLNRTFYEEPSGRDPSNNFAASLLLRFPLFTGFANRYDRIEALRLAEAAEARTADLQQQVILQVWTSYYNLKTAVQRLQTSKDLLESADQSQEVALGRYKAGVGSIIDLVSTQAALANARAQDVKARADWFLGVAQLVHDAGLLEPPAGSATDLRPEGGKGQP